MDPLISKFESQHPGKEIDPVEVLLRYRFVTILDAFEEKEGWFDVWVHPANTETGWLWVGLVKGPKGSQAVKAARQRWPQFSGDGKMHLIELIDPEAEPIVC